MDFRLATGGQGKWNRHRRARSPWASLRRLGRPCRRLLGVVFPDAEVDLGTHKLHKPGPLHRTPRKTRVGALNAVPAGSGLQQIILRCSLYSQMPYQPQVFDILMSFCRVYPFSFSGWGVLKGKQKENPNFGAHLYLWILHDPLVACGNWKHWA